MSKQSEHQSGFSAIELMIAIVIVLLIGIAGWLVYRDHHRATTATGPPGDSHHFSNTSASGNAGAQNYIPGEVFVEFKAGITYTQAEAFITQYKLTLSTDNQSQATFKKKFTNNTITESNGTVVHLQASAAFSVPKGQERTYINELGKSPIIQSVSLNNLYTAQ
jgi:prepilin-type N-terminal cleavage/methylation domain-containing protein